MKHFVLSACLILTGCASVKINDVPITRERVAIGLGLAAIGAVVVVESSKDDGRVANPTIGVPDDRIGPKKPTT